MARRARSGQVDDRSIHPAPALPTSLADADALGRAGTPPIDVADLVFVDGGSDDLELDDFLVDPSAAERATGRPDDAGRRDHLLRGVTDAGGGRGTRRHPSECR